MLSGVIVTDRISCSPTRWFKFRAVAVFLMFGIFAVMFYRDASTGYRKKNMAFFMHAAFQQASRDFERMNAAGSLTPARWERYASSQTVALPEDPTVLPQGVKTPLPWPEILMDYDRMKDLDWLKLWLEYSGNRQLESKPAEHAYDARKILEQWVVCWICAGLSVLAALFYMRTSVRRIEADRSGVRSADGRRVPYADMRIMDLRKWPSKGLAFIDYEGESGKGRLRIDGLTYGGFRPEDGEPAELLMRLIRESFSGEILEYEIALGPDKPAGGAGQDTAGSS